MYIIITFFNRVFLRYNNSIDNPMRHFRAQQRRMNSKFTRRCFDRFSVKHPRFYRGIKKLHQ